MAEALDIATIESSLLEAAIDPSRWSAAMELIAASANSAGAILFDVHGHTSSIPISTSMEASFEAYVKDGWIERDERYKCCPLIERFGVATDRDLFPEETASRHPYYQEFLAPFGLRWFAGVRLAIGKSFWCLSIQRTAAQGAFEPSQLTQLVELSKRLGSVVALSEMLGFARMDAALAAFEISNIAAVVVDKRGEVIRLNCSAEKLMGPDLDIVHHRIRSFNRDATAILEKALKQALLSATTSVTSVPLCLPRKMERPLLACVVRFRWAACEMLSPGQAVIILVDPNQPINPDVNVLRTCFGLTPAEARLARKIGIGERLDTAAAELGISYETARNHLRAIFAKTDTHRQTELLALISATTRIPDRDSSFDFPTIDTAP